MKPKLSVIIAAYNEEKYLNACLASLGHQTYRPIEVIVGDDGSSDGTAEIARYHKVKYFRLNHAGTATVRNAAAGQAEGIILAFLDADMEFEPDFIEKLVRPIVDGKTMGTFSKLEYVKNWDKPLARCWNRNNRPALPDRLRVPQDKDTGDDFRAILKSEFERAGGFDNTGYSDTWSLAKKLRYRPVNAPGAVFYHSNPETFREVFQSASWIGKRRYKLGRLGTLVALARSNPAFSLLNGIRQSLQYREPLFLPFKIVYDLGISRGAFVSLISGEVKK